MRSLTFLAALAVLAAPGVSQAHGWSLEDTAGSLTLTQPAAHYEFLCKADRVRVRELGVTQLMDVQSGVKVGDGPGSKMTPGAALMGLMVGKRQPDLKPAEASANPTKGWDLSIELPLKDPALQDLRKGMQ